MPPRIVATLKNAANYRDFRQKLQKIEVLIYNGSFAHNKYEFGNDQLRFIFGTSPRDSV